MALSTLFHWLSYPSGFLVYPSREPKLYFCFVTSVDLFAWSDSAHITALSMLLNYFLFMEYIEIVKIPGWLKNHLHILWVCVLCLFKNCPIYLSPTHNSICYCCAYACSIVTVNRILEGVRDCVILFHLTELYYQRSTLTCIPSNNMLERCFFLQASSTLSVHQL